VAYFNVLYQNVTGKAERHHKYSVAEIPTN